MFVKLEASGIKTAYRGLDTSDGQRVWRFKQTDFDAVAKEMGCLGIRVEEPGEIRGIPERAFVANRPVLIEVRTDIDARPPGHWR